MSTAKELSPYLKQQPFVAFDTETTGLWAPSNRIVEIAAVRFYLDNEQETTFRSLVNPQKSIPPEVIAIHGITDEMVADAPPASKVMREFIRFCGDDAILIAHNAPFDISFIGCELDRAEITFGNQPILDTVDLFKRYFPGLASYSLLSLSQHFSIAQQQQHRALADAVLVKQLFQLVAGKLGDLKSPSDFSHIASVYHLSDWQARHTLLPEEHRDLNRALEHHLKVQITYESSSRKITTRIIQPRHYYQLGSIYYINAYCERSQEERTFRLDRIGEYRVVE